MSIASLNRSRDRDRARSRAFAVAGQKRVARGEKEQSEGNDGRLLQKSGESITSTSGRPRDNPALTSALEVGSLGTGQI
ncbi:MAG: hypothetical protein QOI53_151 [Verrucomicrobiota bacterium]|nr:hypothetical protein [Verrucomicrobiota bacterium]